MSGSVLVESGRMMNLSLSASVSTPPLRRRRHSPGAFMGQACARLRDARSPSPASYPESILRSKHRHTATDTATTTNITTSSTTNKHVKSSHHHKLCTNLKISSSARSPCPSPASVLSSQLSQISLSTGTCGIDSPPIKPLSPDVLAKRLQEEAPTDQDMPAFFLLDCRSFISFNLKKIREALNVCCTDRCSRRRLTTGKSSILDMVKGTDDEKDCFKKHLQDVDIILYDDNTSNLDNLKDTNNTLQIVGKVLQLQGANKVVYLEGGLDAFQQKYDNLCVQCAKPARTPLYSPTSATIQEPDSIDNATASQILPFLYLGNERDAANEQRLKALGITHVLNVTAHIPFFPEQERLGLIGKRLPASDSGQQNLKQYFNTASAFIDEVREAGGRVLVHCQAGVSRSATVTLAYIMFHSRLSLHEAFSLVKSRRAIVSPNFNFMGQLYSLEQALESGEEQRVLQPALDLGSFPSSQCPDTPQVPQTPCVPATPCVQVPPTPQPSFFPQTPFPKSLSMQQVSRVGNNGFKFC